MNLKLVAVSMGVLGLISSAVFADTDTTTTTTTTHHKYKHHRKHHHHHHVAHHDYKATGAMPAQAMPVADAAPMMGMSSQNLMILEQMEQNVGLAKPMPEWFNRIGVSGGMNFDTGKWGSRTVADPVANGTGAAALAGYEGENTKRFSINNVYLNITADINEWTKALASLSYTDASLNYSRAYQTLPDTGVLGDNNSRLNIEQAFARIGNFDCSPIFVEVGKQFQDFGRYTIHPITESMTQVMSETLRNSLKLGFISDMGFNGSLYTFQNPINKVGNAERTLNYGAALGYANLSDQLGYDIGASYMYNLFGVNDIGNYLLGGPDALGYHTRVGGVAAYADLNFEAFTVGARYTTAVQSFSNLDLPQDLTHLGSGARPWAAGIQAGYDFNAWSRNQNLYLGYQASNQTVYLNLPRQRWLIGYGVDVVKNTMVSAEWDHDISYSIAKGGAGGGNSNLISVRAAVKFG